MKSQYLRISRALVVFAMLLSMFAFVGGHAFASALSSQQVVAGITVPAGGFAGATATCPSNTLRTGGGWIGDSSLNIADNAPISGGWFASAHNVGNVGTLLEVYAVCLSGSSGSVSIVVGSWVSVAPFTSGNATATCLNDDRLTGGGFRVTGTGITASRPTGSSWLVSLSNTSRTNVNIIAFGVCLSAPSVSVSSFPNTVQVAAGADVTNLATCPTNQITVGGGFNSDPGMLVHASYPDYLSKSGSLIGWYAAALNPANFSQALTSYALCAQ